MIINVKSMLRAVFILCIAICVVNQTQAAKVAPVEDVELEIPDDWIDIGGNNLDALTADHASSPVPSGPYVYRDSESEKISVTVQIRNASVDFFPDQHSIIHAGDERLAYHSDTIREAAARRKSLEGSRILSFRDLGKRQCGEAWCFFHQVRFEDANGDRYTTIRIDAPFGNTQTEVTATCPAESPEEIKTVLFGIIKSLSIAVPHAEVDSEGLDLIEENEVGNDQGLMMNPVESLEMLYGMASMHPLFSGAVIFIFIVVYSFAIHKAAKSMGVRSTFLMGFCALLLSQVFGWILSGVFWLLQSACGITLPMDIVYISGPVVASLTIKLVFRVSFGRSLLIWLFSLLLVLIPVIIFFAVSITFMLMAAGGF